MGIFAALMVAFAANCLGQASGIVGQRLDRLRFDHVEESEDFDSIAVISLAQDARGFIWIGTRDGLLRYDGVEFRKYRSDTSDARSLTDNFIDRLHVDASGSLWVCAARGICRYDEATDRFDRFNLGGQGSAVRGVANDAQSRLIVLLESGELFRLDTQTDAFVSISQPIEGAHKSILIDRNNRIWIAGTAGIIELNEACEPARILPLPPEMGAKSGSFFSSMVEAPDGSILVGTNGFGVWRCDPATMQAAPYAATSERSRVIGTLLADAQGNVFIGSTEGLTILRPDSDRPLVYAHREYDPSSLQEGTLYALLIDAQGNLWTGTSRGGLGVAYNKKAFEIVRHSPLDAQSLTKEKVTAILVDSRGRLWTGYHNDGIDILDESQGSKRYLDPFSGEAKSLGKGTIFDLWEDESGMVWVASNWSGLQHVDPDTFAVERFEADAANPGSIAGTDARRIAVDPSGNLWLALHGVGVDIYNPATGKFSRLVGFNHQWVEDLIIDRSGGAWIASSDGLTYLPPRSSVFKEMPIRNSDTSGGLSDRHVFCLLEDSKRRIWAGTRNGLNRIDDPSKPFVLYTDKEGLPSSDIRSVIEDTAGRIWVATSRSLGVLDEANGRFQKFERSDGFASSEMVLRSACKTADGRIYFGSERGIVRFDPSEIRRNTTPPRVELTGVRILNTRLEVSEAPGAILPASPVDLERIVFPAGTNSFGFEFTALNFIAAEKNQFAYKLEGFDAEWIRNGSRRDCSYTNIPPGSYTFRVIASNNDGYWNEEGRSLAVVVMPFFWQRLWFKLSLALVPLLIGVAIYRIRVHGLARQKALLEETVADRTYILQEALDEVEAQKRQIEDQNLELRDHRENLEELVAQRTSELEAAKVQAQESERLKTSFLENVTHEIRTPMNAIIGFLNILKHKNVSEAEKAEYHGIIERSGRVLLALIDDILDLSRMEAESVRLVREPVNISDMFNSLETYYREVVASGRAEIEVILDLDPHTPLPLVVWSDENRIHQVVNNLLDNALKFTERGEVRFSYSLRGSSVGEMRLDIQVSDTGVGIPSDKIGQIFDRFRKVEGSRQKLYRGTGLGLAIVRKVLDLMGGKITVTSDVGLGTTFEIYLPIEVVEE